MTKLSRVWWNAWSQAEDLSHDPCHEMHVLIRVVGHPLRAMRSDRHSQEIGDAIGLSIAVPYNNRYETGAKSKIRRALTSHHTYGVERAASCVPILTRSLPHTGAVVAVRSYRRIWKDGGIPALPRRVAAQAQGKVSREDRLAAVAVQVRVEDLSPFFLGGGWGGVVGCFCRSR